MKEDKIYITIVNWNGFIDTLDCLVSLIDMHYKNFQVVLLDNGSSNQSLDIIKNVLKGKDDENFKSQWKKLLGNTHFKVVDKDFSVEENHEIETNNGNFQHPIVLIRNEENSGFAKGSNICFEYIMEQGDFAYAWLLNNDTVVDADALSNMVKEINTDEKIGMVGSVLIYDEDRKKIQTIGGGRFFPLLSVAKLVHKNTHIDALKEIEKKEVLDKIDYLMGASVLVKKEVLHKIGLFDEDYFVYVEELDWMHRMKKAGWKLSIALDSFVYHKDSASTKDQKEFYFYQLNKNNMLFLKKHYGIFYNLFAVVPVLLNTIRLTRKRRNLKYTIKGLYEGITFKSAKKMIT